MHSYDKYISLKYCQATGWLDKNNSVDVYGIDNAHSCP